MPNAPPRPHTMASGSSSPKNLLPPRPQDPSFTLPHNVMSIFLSPLCFLNSFTIFLCFFHASPCTVGEQIHLYYPYDTYGTTIYSLRFFGAETSVMRVKYRSLSNSMITEGKILRNMLETVTRGSNKQRKLEQFCFSHVIIVVFIGCSSKSMLRIRIRRIRMFLGLLDPDPDPLVRCMDPDPDSSTTKQK